MKLEYDGVKHKWMVTDYDQLSDIHEIISPLLETAEDAFLWMMDRMARQNGFILEFDGPQNIILRELYK